MDEGLEGSGDGGGSLRSFHERRGAVFEPAGDREAVARYEDPEEAHRAVRRGAGVTAVPADIIALTGPDRRTFLNNVVTNVVPEAEGRGCYAFLLDPRGRIETDMTVYAGGDRLLVVTPPGVAADVVEGWETFIQDVDVRLATDEFAVFGVHGPLAGEAVRSAFAGGDLPDAAFGFVRGTVGDAAVTVARTDAPAGEVGYEVVCPAADAPAVAEALVDRGTDAVAFGRAVWRALTLEAGTPLFESELRGNIPNVAGISTGVDLEKGCFVGQEVVSKVANRGQPSRRLVGLAVSGTDPPDGGAAVTADGDDVGTVTRAAVSPALETPIAMASVDFGLDDDAAVSVSVDGVTVAATVEALPFVEGSERSGRIPRYDRD